MAIDFTKIMSASEIARVEAARTAMARMHALPDRFLARELMRLARGARAIAVAGGDAYMADPTHGTYNSSLVWDVIPDLARRLGETEFRPGEGGNALIASRQGQEFREWVGICLRNASLGFRHGYGRDEAVPNACYLLDGEPCNGNPVAIALDRLAPPTAESRDYAAASVREVGRGRFGADAVINAWSPAFQDYRGGRDAA